VVANEIESVVERTIAGLPDRTRQSEAEGRRELMVITFSSSELTCSPNWKRKRFFNRYDLAAGYEPDCLPPEYRRLYDWCENAGYRTALRMGLLDCWILIRW
jgi:hypothetical protein